MRRWLKAAAVCLVGVVPLLGQQPEKSIRLEEHAWPDVEPHLKADSVVMIPLGAAAKEHGPHLKLRNDLTLAEYLTRRVAEASPVVVAPPLTYHFYPAFAEYPGSTTLTLNTARELTVDVVRSLAQHGPRRFYVLNTGISTNRPLQDAAALLAQNGILLRYTDFGAALDSVAKPYREQTRGSHADEVETSLMLFIAPGDVDMAKAAKDDEPRAQPFHLTRRRGGKGTYSPTGIWGDATRATAAKGSVFAEGIVKTILADIAKARTEPLPSPSGQDAPPRSAPAAGSAPAQPGGCTAGDVRTIREIGDAYTYRWSIGDAESLAALWHPSGDIVHPDGTIERTAEVISANRRELFARREYRNSKHPMSLTMIRCLSYDTAIADGRWSLHSVRDAGGKDLPPYEGQATFVVQRLNDAWRIQAYRFTIKPPEQPMPTWLKKPGWPGKG